MAYSQSTYHDRGSMLPSKSRVQSVFNPRGSTLSYRPGVVGHDVNETEFEEDYSDYEEYSGRRSEDSTGQRSQTTLSSFDELQTPDTHNNEFAGFNFQLNNALPPSKSVQGPSGPHLFRMSQDSTSREVDFYLSMSPPASPEDVRVPIHLHQQPKPQPQVRVQSQQQEPKRISKPLEATPPRTSVPLRTWTPRQVAEWMYSIGIDRQIVDTFFINDISGITLIDLQYDDLKELGISSFGQRHRLWTEIKTLKEAKMATPEDEARPLFSPSGPPTELFLEQPVSQEQPRHCESPPSPGSDTFSPTTGRRRHRRHPDDLISPAESASIVAIEQLLPKPHHCAKGENCSKWQKRQRKLAKIATEFPDEMAQIIQSKQSPTESGLGATSIVVPSIVASSDLLGPAKPSIRLQETYLKTVQSRDPQDNVRKFLEFQHITTDKEPESPPYEMFPALSSPQTQAPHSNLKSLPKLTIPNGRQSPKGLASPARTARPSNRGTTPVTALNADQRPLVHDIWRVGSPASEMDVPVTAIPLGPVERDVSSSVPPDMRYGGHQALAGMSISRSSSRAGSRGPPISYNNFMPQHQQTYPQVRPRSNSAMGHKRQPSNITHSIVEEPENAPTEIDDSDDTPIAENMPEHLRDMNHHGWMSKRKTKLLRHEWQDAHFRLKGTQLAMHTDAQTLSALEYIDVDDYAVAISANKSKLDSAMKRLRLNSKDKQLDPAAFAFQLTPAADRKGIMHAATGKTHHFAVKTSTDRIDWMRELMLARARKEKGAEVKSFD